MYWNSFWGTAQISALGFGDIFALLDVTYSTFAMDATSVFSPTLLVLPAGSAQVVAALRWLTNQIVAAIQQSFASSRNRHSEKILLCGGYSCGDHTGGSSTMITKAVTLTFTIIRTFAANSSITESRQSRCYAFLDHQVTFCSWMQKCCLLPYQRLLSNQ